MPRLPKESFNAVLDDDLLNMLDALSRKESFELGEERCKFCLQKKDIDNLDWLHKQSGDIKFIYDSVECSRAI